jgi:hypothetical protein
VFASSRCWTLGQLTTLLDTTMATCARILLQHRAGIRVAVANGDHLTSPGGFQGLNITIDDEPFAIDYYDLDLGSYDMVLGDQWLESLGPILWDFGKRTMAFVHVSHNVLWKAAGAPPPAPSLCTAPADLMEELLQAFAPLFAKPSGLPPPRQRTHFNITFAALFPPIPLHPHPVTKVVRAI